MVKVLIEQVSLKKSKVIKLIHSFVEFHSTHLLFKIKYFGEFDEKDEDDKEIKVERLIDFEQLCVKKHIAGAQIYYNNDENKDIIALSISGIADDPIIPFASKKEAKLFYNKLCEYILFDKMPEK